MIAVPHPLHPQELIVALLAGTLTDPHAFLGLHEVTIADAGSARRGKRRSRPQPLIRAFFPGADAVELVEQGGERAAVALESIHPAGIFAALLPERTAPLHYTLRVTRQGYTWEQRDPYRFLPQRGELDLYLLGEGTHRRLYELLGAHLREVDGVRGVSFAVWAPNARGVSVVGDFNGWHSRAYPMRAMARSGIWELFVPDLAPGAVYKYAIRGADGIETMRADPVGFQSEVRPNNASIVTDLTAYHWGDDDWMTARQERDPFTAPVSIYEVHLGSWRRGEGGRWLTYLELADQLAPYVHDLGYTHIELLPVAEHPYDPSWGYQVTGFYAPTSRYGPPQDFMAFVDRCHQAGIGVFLDWVPAHFAVDGFALARFDGTFLYEPEERSRRNQPDWGTFAFNYGRHEVRNFLLANALYWLEVYHIDGLRVDAVSSMLYLDYSRGPGEWTPNRYGGRENLEAIAFLREFNDLVHQEGRGAVTIAEESTAWPAVSRPASQGGLGFHFKWDMGWMHDTLSYFRLNAIYRQYEQNKLTFRQMYAFSENFLLALSHDEVVHLKASLLHKMAGDDWQRFANLRLLYAYQFAQPGKKLLFMGGEFGQRREWNQDAELDWAALVYPPHAQLRTLIRDLNALHRREPALHRLDHDPATFQWLDFNDTAHSIISFARHFPGDDDRPPEHVVCVFNFTPVPRQNYRIPVPEGGQYRQLLNTDAHDYGGSGVGNDPVVEAEAVLHRGLPHSLVLTIPPLAARYFKPARLSTDASPEPATAGDDETGRGQ